MLLARLPALAINILPLTAPCERSQLSGVANYDKSDFKSQRRMVSEDIIIVFLNSLLNNLLSCPPLQKVIQIKKSRTIQHEINSLE